MWATVLDFCERALTAALAAVGNERARVAELERAGWIDLSRAQSRAGPAASADGVPQTRGLPLGLLLVVFAASQAERLAFLPGHRMLCVCGVPQDLKAALAFTCCVHLLRRWARLPRLLHRLLCAVVLLVLGVDLFLRRNAGVRLHLDLAAFGLATLTNIMTAPALLLTNLAMAPAGTLPTAAAMLPVAALLVRASEVRVRSTWPRLAAVVLAAAVALLVRSPCCGVAQGISAGPCSSAPPDRCCEAKMRAQSPNVLSILAADAWERVSGSDAALSQGRALAQNAIEQLGREDAEATQCKPSTPSQAEPVAAAPGRRSNARRGRRGQGEDTAARGTLLPGRDGGARQACARADPAPPRSRNLVLITVESLGAMYTDLYNPDARTMPFVSGLFNSATPGDAFLLERLYASEPNTMHSLFASLCGMRPHLGMDKPHYSDKQRLARCVPAELRAAGIHSAFYTTSNVGDQTKLGFEEVWSSMEDYTVGNWRRSATDFQKYPGERIGDRPVTGVVPWPAGEWWRHNTSELLRGRTAGRYNWLADHDFFGLPKVRDFVAAQGERRFFLHLLTVSSHHPYGGEREGRGGRHLVTCPSLSERESAYSTMARKPVGTDGQFRTMLASYLRELRCVDEYIKQVHGILRRAGRLHDTSLVIVGDHGEGFTLAHERDRVHGGTVYDTQVHVPFVAFGPIAMKGMEPGMPKRVPGVWSDTSIGPTLLEALGLRHRDCPTLTASVPGPLDVFGCSVLSSPPPRHAMVSCAFDSMCVGLVTQMDPAHGEGRPQLWKFASFGEERLEAYRLDADPYEDNDRSVELPETERKRVLHRMRAWLRAMHEFWSVGTMKRTALPVPTWAIYTGRVGVWTKNPKGGVEGGPQ